VTEKQLRRNGGRYARAYASHRPDARKKQLAFCACCRVTWHLAKLECNRAAIEASEEFADGNVTLRALKRRWNSMRFEPVACVYWVIGAAGPVYPSGGFPNKLPKTEADQAAVAAFHELAARAGEDWERAQTERVIDVFGHELNKFRFERAWATDTAVAVARQMYDSRDFGAMPILADALQDAGCDCETVLSHCRDTNRAHVRGCWVVDLVLGK
jgi:hypothetical protein